MDISRLQNIRLFPLYKCYNCAQVGFKLRMIKAIDSWGMRPPIYACNEVCKMAIIMRQRRESEARWRRFILGIGGGIGV